VGRAAKFVAHASDTTTGTSLCRFTQRREGGKLIRINVAAKVRGARVFLPVHSHVDIRS
jgi:hypothetical protein